MKKYYLHNGFNQSGPFGIEDLHNQQICGDTPIWHKGLDEWTFVDQVPGLMQWIVNPISATGGKLFTDLANTP